MISYTRITALLLFTIVLASCEKEIRPVEITIVKFGALTEKPSDNLPDYARDLLKPMEIGDSVYIPGRFNEADVSGFCFQPQISIIRPDLPNDSIFIIQLPKEDANEVKCMFGTYTYDNIKDDILQYLPNMKASEYMAKKSNNSDDIFTVLDENYDRVFYFSEKYQKNDSIRFNDVKKLRQAIELAIGEKLSTFLIRVDWMYLSSMEISELSDAVTSLNAAFKEYDKCGWYGKNAKNKNKTYIKLYQKVKPLVKESNEIFLEIQRLSETMDPEIKNKQIQLEKLLAEFSNKWFKEMISICGSEPTVVIKDPNPTTTQTCPEDISISFDNAKGQILSTFNPKLQYFFQVASDESFNNIIEEGEIRQNKTQPSRLAFPSTKKELSIVKEISEKEMSMYHWRLKAICSDKTIYSQQLKLSASCRSTGECALGKFQ